jgi:hypothetical protein
MPKSLRRPVEVYALYLPEGGRVDAALPAGQNFIVGRFAR